MYSFGSSSKKIYCTPGTYQDMSATVGDRAYALQFAHSMFDPRIQILCEVTGTVICEKCYSILDFK
jgi:hypothetical protein